MDTTTFNDVVLPELVAHERGAHKVRRFTNIGNLTGHTIGCHNSSYRNLKRGIEERILRTKMNGELKAVIKPDPRFFRSPELRIIASNIARGVNLQPVVTRDLFPSLYQLPRRLMYERAVESLRIKSVCSRDAQVKCFVKCEKLVLDVKPDPVPRIIQPEDVRYNVEVGRYLKPNEKQMMLSLDRVFGSESVVCGQTADRIAELIYTKFHKYRNCAVIGLDASRFDQHVSVDALKYEQSIYNEIFHSKSLRRMLKWQLTTIGRSQGRHKIRYKIAGGRVSGAPNTSCGNKLIMCSLLINFIKTYNLKCEVLNNGDDVLLFMDKKSLATCDHISDYFKMAGFKLVIEKPVYRMEDIEFCQMNPINDGLKYRMARKIDLVLSKDLMCYKYGHEMNSYMNWLGSVGSCGLAMSGNLPVYGRFYDYLHSLATKPVSVEGGLGYWTRFMSGKYVTPTDEARLSFYINNRITPDEQIMLEESFDFSFTPVDNAPKLSTSIYFK
nr:RNA polymerase [Flumine tombus-like virus 22]